MKWLFATLRDISEGGWVYPLWTGVDLGGRKVESVCITISLHQALHGSGVLAGFLGGDPPWVGAVRTLFAHAQGEGGSETALKAVLGPRHAVPPTCGMLFHLHIAPVVVSSSQKRKLKLGMIHEHG